MHSPHLSVCLFPHPLNPSLSINPLQKPATGSDIRQHYPSCFAMLQQSPGNSSIYRSQSAGRARRRWREGRRSRIEWGSGRWRAGEGGFFGKGANPITGSGAALVSLAALNSHFNGLFLPPPVPSSFSFYLCLFLLLFSDFFSSWFTLIPPPNQASPQNTPLPFSHLSVSLGCLREVEVWNCITSKASHLVTL